MKGTVTTVMFDTVDVDEAVRFWSAVLELEVVHRTVDYAYMSPLSPGGPHLAFQQVAEPKSTKNRLHLDVKVPDRRAFEDKVLALGGSVVREVRQEGFPTWSVVTDAQGNEFCVYSREEPAAG